MPQFRFRLGQHEDTVNRITNGTFDTNLSGWSSGGTFIWSGGKALMDANDSATLSQAGVFQIGRRYRIKYDGLVSIADGLYNIVRGLLITDKTTYIDGSTPYTFTHDIFALSTFFSLNVLTETNFSNFFLDNISAHELIWNEPLIDEPLNWKESKITKKRDDKLNALVQQYIEKLTFSGEGYRIIRNELEISGVCGSVPILIEKNCADGSFEVFFEGLIYLKDCSFDESKCVVDCSVEDVDSTFLLNNNKDEVLPFTITDQISFHHESGSYPAFGDLCDGNAITNGDFGTGDFTGYDEFDNWTVVAGKAVHTTKDTEPLAQYDKLKKQRRYQVTFTISGFVSGGVFVKLGSQKGTTRTANGTYVQEIVASDVNFYLYPTNNGAAVCDLKVDDILIERICEEYQFVDSANVNTLLYNRVLTASEGRMQYVNYFDNIYLTIGSNVRHFFGGGDEVKQISFAQLFRNLDYIYNLTMEFFTDTDGLRKVRLINKYDAQQRNTSPILIMRNIPDFKWKFDNENIVRSLLIGYKKVRQNKLLNGIEYNTNIRCGDKKENRVSEWIQDSAIIFDLLNGSVNNDSADDYYDEDYVIVECYIDGFDTKTKQFGASFLYNGNIDVEDNMLRLIYTLQSDYKRQSTTSTVDEIISKPNQRLLRIFEFDYPISKLEFDAITSVFNIVTINKGNINSEDINGYVLGAEYNVIRG